MMVSSHQALEVGRSARKNSEPGSLFFIGLTVLLLLGACQPANQPSVATLSGPTMGTDYRVTVIAQPGTDLAALQQGIDQQLESVNQSMSNWLTDSEISRFNRLPAGQRMVLSNELRQVVEQALAISALSDGAFDITLAPAVNVWGFGPDGKVSRRPDATQLADLRARIGYRKLLLDPQGLRKSVADVSIDLSAIAKGYAVDRVSEWLSAQGIARHLVDVGGELRATGLNPQQGPWRVGIEKPNLLGGIQEIVELADMAIATSGDYRNFISLEGQTYSHTIDSQTLSPALHKLASVSVMHPSAMVADALATALLAMGETRAEEFARQQRLSVFLLIRTATPGDYRVIQTENFTLLQQ